MFIFALLCVSFVRADSDVVILDPENFDSEIASSGITLVEFFAPWCGHCKALAPNYEKAATELKGSAKLGSVDCTIHRDLCSRFGVQGFPTLKIFRQGGDISKPSEYQGGRTASEIVKYMKKQSEPAYVTLSSAADVDAFAGKDDDVKIIGLFADATSAEAKNFLGAADDLRNDYSFAIVSDAAFVAKYGASSPAVILLKTEDSKAEHVVTSNEVTLSGRDSIGAWVKAEAFPLVGEIGPENFQKYLDRGLPLVWVFVDFKSDATAAALSEATTAAAAYKGRISVVKLDGIRWGEHAKHFGLSGKLPGIVAEDRENNKNYVFPEDAPVTADSLKNHFEGFLTGTLQPTLKSQEPPTDNDGPVKVVVGKTFESIVLDDSKDVLVEFYAPWCGHCKTLAPKYDALGEKFVGTPSVVIAKVDATENDTPANIQGFPTLIFYPAGDKKNPITYEGDRTAEAMEAFVRENAKTLAGASASAPAHEEL